ncbi:hypothetical protein CC1G_05930 [Coprinopsis cinerea okayama7|uniref:F-box domain-containing protein n=1 Tax=Coprinopsis cinerea (strain Okayama-7 / 130 / ATCC MYA-4618 / FGSC 9003) TaxID=240176 RepID=A8NAH9_COPC7|nr:hypothetical protein CC1G_05930 [Coprinopsis cinerea okayama7\|eukprot:XP_001831831.2 hypothetical protein CC1G_05930 [Coprinopsis cinerea okayama7\
MPQELLREVVGHLVTEPNALRLLKRLSLVHRAFTPICQTYIFEDLRLSGFKENIQSQLRRKHKILHLKPECTDLVKLVVLRYIEGRDPSWLFEDSRFLDIFKSLSESKRRPSSLELYTICPHPSPENAIGLCWERITNFFASASLTNLTLWNCKGVPLKLIAACPNLRSLDLFRTSPEPSRTEDLLHLQPDTAQPKLVKLVYNQTNGLLKNLLGPSPDTPSILDLSDLRVIETCPMAKDEMDLIPEILRRSRASVEVVQCIKSLAPDHEQDRYLPLSTYLSFHDTPLLRNVELVAEIVDTDANASIVIADICSVLQTIPSASKVHRIKLAVLVRGEKPFTHGLNQEWRRLGDQIARISSEDRLVFELNVKACRVRGFLSRADHAPLYEHVRNELANLNSLPHIMMEFTNPLNAEPDWECDSDSGSDITSSSDTYSDSGDPWTDESDFGERGSYTGGESSDSEDSYDSGEVYLDEEGSSFGSLDEEDSDGGAERSGNEDTGTEV